MDKSNQKIIDLSSFEVNGIPCPMVYIEGGTFEMGSNEREREQPIHSVIVPSFYLGKFLVTQSLFENVMGKNPSHFQGITRPVEQVSWEDAELFISCLNEMTKHEFRLPTEAEWEYAAKGGEQSEGYQYCGSDNLKQVGWYGENSGQETKPVGLLLPNESGIHDMSGNVWEWCKKDRYSDYQNTSDDSTWNIKSDSTANYVVHGGSCFSNSIGCVPSSSNIVFPGSHSEVIGFRLCMGGSSQIVEGS